MACPPEQDKHTPPESPRTPPEPWPRDSWFRRRRAHGARLTEPSRRVDLANLDPFLKCEMDSSLFLEYRDISGVIFEYRDVDGGISHTENSQGLFRMRH